MDEEKSKHASLPEEDGFGSGIIAEFPVKLDEEKSKHASLPEEDGVWLSTIAEFQVAREKGLAMLCTCEKECNK